MLRQSHRNEVQRNRPLLLGKSLHEEGIEKRRISKLQRREHQKVKRKMGIGKQIEKTLIMEMLIMIMIMSCLWK